MKIIFGIVSLLMLSCTHSVLNEKNNRKSASSEEFSYDKMNCEQLQYSNVPSENLTIWILQKMAECEQYDKLNDLYNNQSVKLESLPRGYAAGTGAKVFGLESKIATKILDIMTGNQWKGKMFFPSVNPKETRGLNRIRSLAIHVVPMASFVSKLVDRHELVPEIKSGANVVLLNYAHPIRNPENPYFQEKLLKKIQVYDLMVAVPGKYGPLYVGKTWLGKYDSQTGEFSTDKPDKLIAWYFLDFNEGALKEQKEKYWDGENEKMLSPLPQINEQTIQY